MYTKHIYLTIAVLTSAGIAGAMAAERNVALATAGGVVTVSSFMDGTDNGEAASACLNDGKWLDKASDDPRGVVWRSYRYYKAPQWAWIRFACLRRVDRVVLHASSVQNHPIDYRIQTSDDGGVTVKALAVVKNQVAPHADALAMEVKFPAVITDNVRVLIERSGAVPGEAHSESTQLPTRTRARMATRWPTAHSAAPPTYSASRDKRTKPNILTSWPIASARPTCQHF
jgi:hypothetical protein